MARSWQVGVLLAFGFWNAEAECQVSGPDTVIVVNGNLRLRALLWQPPGDGPFPAVLFNHGSGHTSGVDAAGRPDQRHPDLLGPLFADRGYVFLHLYRRGDGLSRGQGRAAGDRMDSAFAAGGQSARNEVQLGLLETDEIRDVMAGLGYLRSLARVDPGRIVVVGHSFGGSLALLLAEREPVLRALVLFSAAGYSWQLSPELRSRLRAAMRRSMVPVLFLHALNDYSLEAGLQLSAQVTGQGRVAQLARYPAAGASAAEGHDFVYTMVSTWEPDVFKFLEQHAR